MFLPRGPTDTVFRRVFELCAHVSLDQYPPHIVQAVLADVLRQTLVPSLPATGLTGSWLFLVIAIVGTTIAPWQLFFQQSCVAEKRLRFADLKWARLDTLIGAIFTVCVAGAMMLVGNFGYQHHIPFENPAQLAVAFGPLAGHLVRNALLLLMVNAAVLGATAISLASAWASVTGLAGLLGTSLQMRSTWPYGIPSTRPTSRSTARACSLPKVMICATRSAPYSWRT